ncbi:hypothetical protein B566_EDAN017472 [Ephemera danica]|nr:hypothetical protein B566_EDAN017472 [Ephemera danica]
MLQFVILFVKLSALMGLPWIMEIVSWAVGGEDHYWYFTDAINMLRSVFIFIVFCCKPKVWEMLKRHSKVSPSIRWFSRRVGRENIMFPPSKDHPESTVSTNASTANDGEKFQQLQENIDRKSDVQTGITNRAFETHEMQDRKTNN